MHDIIDYSIRIDKTLKTSHKLMKNNILLTGQPGIGKTTAIKTIIDSLNLDQARGFWSEEIREKRGRVGFSIQTLSGKTGILAHVDIMEGPSVSKYRVNIPDIDSIIVPELVRAREAGSIIIIDEIAKMELYSKRFPEEVHKCLDTGRVLGTIQKRQHSFLDEVRSRGDVKLIELTVNNRNQLPSLVLELLEK